MPRADIETREDCELLVRSFYARALTDPLIGFLFTDVARLDLEAHVPKVADFWETILLGAPSYRGGAYAPHALLHRQVPLLSGHFDRWLVLWEAAVDEHFDGPRATEAKAHAQRVARAFQRRLAGLPPEEPEPGAGLLQISLHAPAPDAGRG